MNTATDTLETNTVKTGGGYTVGQSATDTIGFYGATPVAQIGAAGQAAITDGMGGTAAATNGVAILTGTYNSTLLVNAFSTVIAAINAQRAALVSLGLIKGSA
jgi:hypothetical protein